MQEYYLGRMEPKVLDEKPPGIELMFTFLAWRQSSLIPDLHVDQSAFL